MACKHCSTWLSIVSGFGPRCVGQELENQRARNGKQSRQCAVLKMLKPTYCGTRLMFESRDKNYRIRQVEDDFIVGSERMHPIVTVVASLGLLFNPHPDTLIHCIAAHIAYTYSRTLPHRISVPLDASHAVERAAQSTYVSHSASARDT